jgi:hypothetical protein
VRTPEGQAHFTLLQLAEAVVRAYQEDVEAPGHLEEHGERYPDCAGTEDALSRYMLIGIDCFPPGSEDAPDGKYEAQMGFSSASMPSPFHREPPPQYKLDEEAEMERRYANGVRFITAPPEEPPKDAPPDDDDEPPEEDWVYVALTAEWQSENLHLLRGADDIVISQPSIRVVFSKPFREEFEITLLAPGGATSFTRRALADAIGAQYQRMFAEEEAATKPSEEQGSDSEGGGAGGAMVRLANRTATDGPYGIGYHGLGDLVLHAIWFDDERKAYRMMIDT